MEASLGMHASRREDYMRFLGDDIVQQEHTPIRGIVDEIVNDIEQSER